MKYWLMKSEPSCFSIDDLKKVKISPWDGVRNFQARNFMRDEMQVGDLVFFYHSNAKPSAIVGLAKIASKPYPDATAFDPEDDHYDEKSDRDNPTWILVDVEYIKAFKEPLSLQDLKGYKELEGMELLKKGSRLSIQPVSKNHFEFIKSLSE